MIALAVLQLALGQIGPQTLPPTGCAAFLWSRTETPQLIAMVGAEPGALRLQLDGRTLDLSRTGMDGTAALGFTPIARYAAGGISATVELTVDPRRDIAQGAAVPQATLTVEQAGKDTLIVPAAGLIGCAEGQR